MVCQGCDHHSAAFGGADRDPARRQHGLHGQRLCQHGAVGGDHHVPLRAGLYAHGQPDRQAFCDADLYDDPRCDFPADGKLVLASLLCSRGNPLRGDSLEGRLLPKTETADRRLDGGEPAVQRGQSAPHLVLLGHLLRFCAGKRHGAELHRFLCALLHLSRLAGLYSAVHDADGLFRLHGGQSADPQAFSEGRRSMRADASFAVPVKLWALLCVFAGVTIGGNVLLTCILTGGALLYLVLQRNFRLAASYGCFYLLLALLLYGIRFHGLRMPVFSEFYVLMFWNLSPIFLVSWDLITTPPGMLSAFLSRLRMPTPFILGLLVVFRFFPTMRTELKGVGRSMKNRGLTAAGQLLAHPVQSMEYVLVPFLLRVLQLADQLSVSAVARGAERPGVRGSYYEKRAGARDHIAAAACALVTASYLVLERSMA